MFNAKTERIDKLSKKYANRIKELDLIFDKPTNIYIDFANVIRWQGKLQWHIELKRLKQLLDSFDTVKDVRYYSGTLIGDAKSEESIEDIRRCKYTVITKPVKIFRIPINIASIPLSSPDIVKQFIRPPLLEKMNIETIKFINSRLKELNKQGIMYLEDKKCNFDVEIGSDMLLANNSGEVENFILWSGDSDFEPPLKQLLSDKKKCVVFSTVRRVAKELNDLRNNGLFIYEIQKIKNFICWGREMNPGDK